MLFYLNDFAGLPGGRESSSRTRVARTYSELPADQRQEKQLVEQPSVVSDQQGEKSSSKGSSFSKPLKWLKEKVKDKV